MKIFSIFFIISISTLFLTSCSSNKHHIKFNKNEEIDFYSKEFGLIAKGKIKIKVEYNTVIVTITEGSIFINPDAPNENYTVGDIYASLGKSLDSVKGSWTTTHQSKKTTIEANLPTKMDSINISNYQFIIPYYDNKFPKNTWIVFSINDFHRRGWAYSHSEFIN